MLHMQKWLGRKGFCEALDAYRENRPSGDKEHRRAVDIAAGSISTQKLYGTPVGLMFFKGAPRLLEAGVTIPGLQQGDLGRIEDRNEVGLGLAGGCWRVKQIPG
jgi:hypothetical protein